MQGIVRLVAEQGTIVVAETSLEDSRLRAGYLVESDACILQGLVRYLEQLSLLWVDGLCFLPGNAKEACVKRCDGMVKEVGSLLIYLCSSNALAKSREMRSIGIGVGIS